ncbi:hypothetical protein COCNU_scaffold004562G000010 [Cocos nucifera]|nr:hypothetical protein [Cocos nucifera]
MLEMVDHMADLDLLQLAWSSLGTILKTALALEEERKKEADNKVTKLEARMVKSILEVMTQAMEELKASFEMRNLNVKFSQEVFIKGFKLYEGGSPKTLNKRPEEESPSTEEEVKEDRGQPSSFMEECFGGNQRGHSPPKLAQEGLRQFQHLEGELRERAG